MTTRQQVHWPRLSHTFSYHINWLQIVHNTEHQPSKNLTNSSMANSLPIRRILWKSTRNFWVTLFTRRQTMAGKTVPDAEEAATRESTNKACALLRCDNYEQDAEMHKNHRLTHSSICSGEHISYKYSSSVWVQTAATKTGCQIWTSLSRPQLASSQTEQAVSAASCGSRETRAAAESLAAAATHCSQPAKLRPRKISQHQDTEHQSPPPQRWISEGRRQVTADNSRQARQRWYKAVSPAMDLAAWCWLPRLPATYPANAPASWSFCKQTAKVLQSPATTTLWHHILQKYCTNKTTTTTVLYPRYRSTCSRVVSVLDSGAEGLGSNRSRDTVE